MARKSRKGKGTTKRRKVGGLNLSANSPLVKFGSIAAGYLLGEKLNDLVEKATGDKVDGKIIAGAEAGVGLLLMMKKGKKSVPLQIISGVLIGAGVKKGLQEFGVINGFSDVPVISGYKSVPVLSGYNVPGSVNGFTVPRPVASVMGSIDGGTGINASDR